MSALSISGLRIEFSTGFCLLSVLLVRSVTYYTFCIYYIRLLPDQQLIYQIIKVISSPTQIIINFLLHYKFTRSTAINTAKSKAKNNIKYIITYILSIVQKNMKKSIPEHQDEYNLYHRSQKIVQSNKSNTRNQKYIQNGYQNLHTGNSLSKNQQFLQNQRISHNQPINYNQIMKKNEKQDDQTKASKDQSNISSNQLSTTTMEYENQIERLTIEIITKNKQIATLTKYNQKKKVQIIQLQKNKNYNQGKLKYMAQQLQKYQNIFIKLGKQCDDRAKTRSQVGQLAGLYQDLRKSNQQINGKYQEKCYQLNKLTDKYVRLKGKLNQSKNSDNCSSGNRSKSKSLARFNQNSLMKKSSIIQSYAKYDEVQNQYQGNNNNNASLEILNVKIKQIQQTLCNLDEQNKKLNKQLQQKDIQCTQLSKQLQKYKKYYRRSSHSKQSSINDKKSRNNSSQNRDNNIRQSTSIKQQYQLITQPSTTFINNSNNINNNININNNNIIQRSNNNVNKIKLTDIFRKLKYNLIMEQITYQEIINILGSDQINCAMLVQYPYLLSQIQAQYLIKWLNTQKGIKQSSSQCDLSVISSASKLEIVPKDITKMLTQKFPKYTPIMLRRQYSTKIHIYNTYQNRQQQFQQLLFSKSINKKGNSPVNTKYQQAEIYFQNIWGLNQEQIDVLMKSYYDYTGHLDKVQYAVVKEVIKQWGKL